MIKRTKQKAKFKTLILYWLPSILWALFIFFFSSRATAVTSHIYWQDFVVKKIAHLLEYGIFSLLNYRAFLASGLEKKKAGVYAIVLSVVYGISDEIHQTFTPGRQPRIYDVLFDTMGASLAIYSIWNLLPKAPEKIRNWAKRAEIS